MSEVLNNTKITIENLQVVIEEYRQKFDRFSELLIAENQKYNLTRIDSPRQIETRHFLDSLAGLSLLDELSQRTGQPLKILDIGSGAGFPGLVLAVVRPAWQIVSLERDEVLIAKGKYAKEVVFDRHADFRNQLGKLDYILDYYRTSQNGRIENVDLTLGDQVPVRSL